MEYPARPMVGFVGLGNIGSPMARCLLKAGYGLIVHDQNFDAGRSLIAEGALWADNARELAQQSDVIFTCLPSLEAIEEVALGANGILHGARRGQVYIETSTNSPALLKRLYAAFAEKGVQLLDAPVSGGVASARRGRLAMWVGGDVEAFSRCEPILSTMSDAPVHIGRSGAGLITKLVNNSATLAMNLAAAEAFVLGVKAGADPLALWKAIRQGIAGRGRAFDGLANQFMPGDYDATNAPLRIIYKDISIATELASELGVSMRTGDFALAEVKQAMDRGWENRDSRCVLLLPQERSGISIAVARDDIAEVLRRDPPAPGDNRFN